MNIQAIQVIQVIQAIQVNPSSCSDSSAPASVYGAIESDTEIHDDADPVESELADLEKLMARPDPPSPPELQ